jgi:hypothetical protein
MNTEPAKYVRYALFADKITVPLHPPAIGDCELDRASAPNHAEQQGIGRPCE